jgi:hypothetical protein
VPEWGRVQQIEVSPFSADTAYVAFDLHEVDNNRPYVFKTKDGGKTWTSIVNGLRPNEPARVLREDPNQRGFLVLGTDTGLYWSRDDGDHWTPLKGNFPTVPIYDLKFVKATHDLLVATHGRGMFVLDNITPLVEMTPQVANSDFHLFSTSPANRWLLWNKRGFQKAGFIAPNPPNGAVIDYFLNKEIEVSPEMKQKKQTPVKITITDESGKVIRSFFGSSKYGINRETWDLKHEDPVQLNFRPEPEEGEFTEAHIGPHVVPGTYKINVTFGGKTLSQTVKVDPDPRFQADMAAFQAQTQAGLQVRDQLSAINESINRLEGMRAQLTALEKFMTSGAQPSDIPAAYKQLADQASQLEKKLKDFESTGFNIEVQPESMDSIRFHDKLHDRVQSLLQQITFGYNQAPSPLHVEEMANLRQLTETYINNFNNLLKTDIANYNKMALERGASTLFTGLPIQLRPAPIPAAGKQ